MTHHVLDVRNLLCPLPVIRAQNAVARLAAGDTLEVHATDPGALHDIPAWCRINGHDVLSTSKNGGEVRITVKVNV
ncbi:MAG: sulfurtransferase TusA family protein [Sulfurifustaceae bacterium]